MNKQKAPEKTKTKEIEKPGLVRHIAEWVTGKDGRMVRSQLGGGEMADW